MAAGDNVFDDLFGGDTTRTALLLIDYQVDVCAAGGKMVSQDDAVLSRFRQAREMAGSLLAAARRHGVPRFHVTHLYEPGYPELRHDKLSGMASYMMQKEAFVRGTPGAAIVDEVAPIAGEAVLAKTSISPFATTDLAVRLQRQQIDTVVIAGVVTHYAVLATTLAATDRGYHAVVVADACTSGNHDNHEAALGILGPLADIWRDPWS